MGLCELEAEVLSGETQLEEISGVLRESPKFCGSQLYVPSNSHRKLISRLIAATPPEFKIRD